MRHRLEPNVFYNFVKQVVVEGLTYFKRLAR